MSGYYSCASPSNSVDRRYDRRSEYEEFFVYRYTDRNKSDMLLPFRASVYCKIRLRVIAATGSLQLIVGLRLVDLPF